MNSWQNSCRTDGCEVITYKFYCGACFRSLLADLEARCDAVSARAVAVYVGRTAYPEHRLLEHNLKGRESLTVLHWASDIEEADYLEAMLIDTVGKLRKLDNRTEGGDGRFAGAFNCVYLSWKAHSGPIGLESIHVDALDRGERLWPESRPSFKGEHLFTTLTPEETRGVLDGHALRNSSYMKRRKVSRS